MPVTDHRHVTRIDLRRRRQRPALGGPAKNSEHRIEPWRRTATHGCRHAQHASGRGQHLEGVGDAVRKVGACAVRCDDLVATVAERNFSVEDDDEFVLDAVGVEGGPNPRGASNSTAASAPVSPAVALKVTRLSSA